MLKIVLKFVFRYLNQRLLFILLLKVTGGVRDNPLVKRSLVCSMTVVTSQTSIAVSFELLLCYF